jgi:hypothetical protein
VKRSNKPSQLACSQRVEDEDDDDDEDDFFGRFGGASIHDLDGGAQLDIIEKSLRHLSRHPNAAVRGGVAG